MWEVGNKLVRESNPEDGVGVVTAVESRFIDVHFPLTDTNLRLSPAAAGISPFRFYVGTPVVVDEQERVIVKIRSGLATLDDDSIFPVSELWPVYRQKTLFERLRAGDIDPVDDVIIRLDGYRLLDLRRRGLIPSLLGGRVELFPHQLDTAARVIQKETVRWLLADEVGLGKTIVACMITSAMVRMGRTNRVLIISPETLTVQWLGELYRKFHQVFVHIDEERLQHVATDFGADANPFDIYQLGIISIDLLLSRPDLIATLNANPPEMIVIDEAHRIIGTDIEYDVLPFVEHTLLLTATPFHGGTKGFVRMMDMLDLPYEQSGDQHIAHQVSVVTRDDIHALGQRIPQPTPVDHFGEISADEPRVAWLIEAVKRWKKEGERALVFVEDAARAKQLSDILYRASDIAVFVFHEEMNAGARDIELSRFRLSNSPVLVSSGAGSEGRNFQFCDEIVHFDLPPDPVVLEQRIGRVDRIGRDRDIPIIYFTTDGPDGGRAKVYETIGIFEDPSVGASPALLGLRSKLAFGGFQQEEIPQMLEDVLKDLAVEKAQWLFPDSHDKASSAEVLAQIPEDYEALIERFCYERADKIGFDIVEKEGFSVYFFEYGAGVEVEAIPGITPGDRYLGTFERSEAVQNELIDFFSNGHPLVEALLNELEDSAHGRIGALQLKADDLGGLRGAFLLLIEDAAVPKPRLVPLAAVVSDPADLERAATHLFDHLTDRPTLSKRQVAALATKYLSDDSIDETAVRFALLLVAM